MRKNKVHTWLEVMKHPAVLSTVAVVSWIGLSLYSGQSFALEEGDKVRELAGLTSETQKMVRNGCYIAGSASTLVGAIWSVASQSIKVAASSIVITIIALKSAGFFSGTMVI